MSGTWKPWSDNPNAPQIPYVYYFTEKVGLAGTFLGAILYGVAAILFFQCMSALLNPTNRTGSIKWGLVVHTAAMFLVLTLDALMSIAIYPISYVDNRGFPGNSMFPPGPSAYQWFTYSEAISVIPSAMFFLNTCLADGFLLYRCYIIYSMNYWVVILPCMMYLASLALGIVLTYYQASKPAAVWNYSVAHLGLPCYTISLSLNILLTLMIAARLIRHSRNIRKAIGPNTDNGLYNTVVTILVESCVLYAVVSLLFLGPFGAGSPVEAIFVPAFVSIQVIAPFFVVLRVANRTALTSEVVASGNVGSIRFKSQGESTGGNGTLPDGNPLGSVETNGETPGEPGTWTESIIEEVLV